MVDFHLSTCKIVIKSVGRYTRLEIIDTRAHTPTKRNEKQCRISRVIPITGMHLYFIVFNLIRHNNYHADMLICYEYLLHDAYNVCIFYLVNRQVPIHEFVLILYYIDVCTVCSKRLT